MNPSDISAILAWWAMLFSIGLVFLPLTASIFSNFFDKGYIFSKIIGFLFISYFVFILGILKLSTFSRIEILLSIVIFAGINLLILLRKNAGEQIKKNFKIFIFEEILFVLALFFLSYVRSFQPDIHGLEKYMDFGFINSILRSDYFPPKDMWFPPFPINYYYFGHLITAVLTKLSNIPSSITFNLMLGTIFAFTFCTAFSIGSNLFNNFLSINKSGKKGNNQKFSASKLFRVPIIAGLLSASLITFAGNFHTIYTFFKPYQNESPVPIWNLAFSPLSFPNSYWYPNATRFIHNTIHEFPIYSFVVSDLHGHVLDIPIVLLTIAVLFSLISNTEYRNPKQKSFGHSIIENLNLFRISNFEFRILLLSFLIAVMYMTNAWDGIIYFLLTSVILIYLIFRKPFSNLSARSESEDSSESMTYKQDFKLKIYSFIFLIIILGLGFYIFTFPFNHFFKPFVSGIGILCAPQFLTDIGKIGPFLFEADHCQKSPIWQMLTLYGFFYLWIIVFLIFLKKKNHESRITNHKQTTNSNARNSKSFGILNFKNWNLSGIWNLEFGISTSDIFILILIFISTLLIIIPEFIYIKDIYPAHYRANTMFKLVYQSFILLSIASGYIIVRVFSNWKIVNYKWKILPLVIIGMISLSLVMIYPFYSINSYYGDLRNYKGLNGILYLKSLYPTDYNAILWLNENIQNEPVILEAQGDSYTDYARVSANTGLPTVLGWTVHEWLWRGTYDIPAPRIADVTNLYEMNDIQLTKSLLEKYKVSLVFIGALERQKYPKINEQKFAKLGALIYQNGQTKIYKIINF